MKTRGRNSSASKAIILGGFGERPSPPAELTKRQISIWNAVVTSENPDFFKSEVSRALLADYCRRRAACEEISAVIDRFGGDWKGNPEALGRYSQLLQMRGREMEATMRVATKLRLTNQSRYVKESAASADKRAARQDIPWRKSA
jgi:hypothetical protein